MVIGRWSGRQWIALLGVSLIQISFNWNGFVLTPNCLFWLSAFQTKHIRGGLSSKHSREYPLRRG